MNEVILIDDEINICRNIKLALTQSGYQCRFFTDPSKGLTALKKKLPALVVLDIVMPGIDGIELCREIRKLSETLPVIFLSSKDEEFDRILGLEIGADDYLCKPFSMKELIARIKVCIRRSRLMNSASVQAGKATVKSGELEINAHTYTASWKDTPLTLTVTEFRLLYALAKEEGIVKTREQLLSKAYPSDHYVSDRTIDTHIKRNGA